MKGGSRKGGGGSQNKREGPEIESDLKNQQNELNKGLDKHSFSRS